MTQCGLRSEWQHSRRARRDTKRALQVHVETAVAGPLELAIQAELASFAFAAHADRIRERLDRSKR